MKNESAHSPPPEDSGLFSCKGLDNYEIHFPIGRGAHSFVYRAQHRTSGQLVALKVIEARTERETRRVRREVRLHRQLNHPHIVQLIDYFCHENSHILVLEFCAKGEFFPHFSKNKGRFSENDIRRYLFQAISALECVHSQGVVHRDVKMGNLLLSESGDLKLADFGLSVPFQDRDAFKNDVVAGTPNYLPPEFVLDNKITFSNDLWAVGCFGYALLCGHLPFEGEDYHATLQNIVKKPVNLEGKCSEGMLQVMQVLLDRNYQNRRSARRILSMPWFSGGDGPGEGGPDSENLCKGNRTGSTLATTGFPSGFGSSFEKAIGSQTMSAFGTRTSNGPQVSLHPSDTFDPKKTKDTHPFLSKGIGTFSTAKERTSSLKRWPTDAKSSVPKPPAPSYPFFGSTQTTFRTAGPDGRVRPQSIIKSRVNLQSVLDGLTQRFEIRAPAKQ